MKKLVKVMPRLLLPILFISCNSLAPVEGALTAFIYPVDDVVIDGDLSDWPGNTKKYVLKALSDGDSTTKAYVQMGYLADENSLVVGVSYYDDRSVVDKETNWMQQDSYSFYIDEENRVKGSGVNRYSFNELMTQDRDPNSSWDPLARNYFGWEKMERKERSEDNQRFIEFKYQLAKPIRLGESIGVNHVLTDRDSSDQLPVYHAWLSDPYADKTNGRLGSVVFVTKETQQIPFAGRIVLQGGLESFPSSFILSRTDQSGWFRVKISETGSFDTSIPFGEYEIIFQNDLLKDGESYDKVDLASSYGGLRLDKQGSQGLEIPLTKVPLKNLIPEVGLLADGFSDSDKLKIDEFVETYQEYFEIPGVLLSVIENGEVVYNQSYGISNSYTNGPEVTVNTIFEAASMTKPMFAFAVLRLADKGIIDLDKPLYQYVAPPEDVKDNPWHQLITARMVLNHVTGFPNWADNMPDGKLAFLFEPGTDVGYSGEGFTFLRRAVDAITGRPITEILQEEVVDVLQLTDMYFKDTPGLAERKANGHVFSNTRIEEIPTEAEMASTLHTTAKSYAEFVLALSKRKGLRPETYRAFINRTVVRSERMEGDKIQKNYFSLGLSLRDSPNFGLSFGHSGSNGDFKCTSTMYEDTKDGFVVMTNSSTGEQLHWRLHNLLNIGTKQVDP